MSKTQATYEYVVEQYTGKQYGWEEVDSQPDTKAGKQEAERLAGEYRIATPSMSVRVRRVKVKPA